MTRIAALVAKDFAELRKSPGIFVPALLTGCAAILYPFVIAVLIPYFTGEQLADSSDFEIAELFYKTEPAARPLKPIFLSPVSNVESVRSASLCRRADR